MSNTTKGGRVIEMDSDGFWTIAAQDLEVGDEIVIYPFADTPALSRTVEVEDVLRPISGARSIAHTEAFDLPSGIVLCAKDARVRLDATYARSIVS